ncbi:hypothetical protein BJY01DRAFT_254926 [Aspergillus pseudoustus]|uniref:FAD-binding domain-containing protein n=1 Tax=Aspergillus pseudoustus TaxID=1810923 RepID=A0ABR4IPE1_9EURO
MNTSQSESELTGGLRILLLGDGLDMCLAALALLHRGHTLTVLSYKTSSQIALSENGIIHLTPNIMALIQRLGLDDEDIKSIGGLRIRKLVETDGVGNTIGILDYQELEGKIWQHPWFVVGHVALADMLRSRIQATKNTRIQFILEEGAISSTDAPGGIVTFENGNTYSGDLIVAADGAQSKMLLSAQQLFRDGTEHHFPAATGNLETEAASSNTAQVASGVLWRWITDDGFTSVTRGEGSTICHTLCGGSHGTQSTSGTFTAATAPEARAGNYPEHCSDKGVISYSTAMALEVNQVPATEGLRGDRNVRWIEGRVVFVGDASHLCEPCTGTPEESICLEAAQQLTAFSDLFPGFNLTMTIEDVVSLAAIIPFDMGSECLLPLLTLFADTRTARFEQIRDIIRAERKRLPQSIPSGDPPAWPGIVFGYNAWDNAISNLRNWVWKSNPNVYWRMPICFGPMPGPRQDGQGKRHPSADSTFYNASIRFHTSRTVLESFLPNGSFRFSSPGTLAEATFAYSAIDRMAWLGGSGYRMFGLTLHGIEYTKKDGSVLPVSFLVVLFEDLADPIISGREELGFPKLFASIHVTQDQDSLELLLHWRGHRFARAQWHGLHAVQRLEELEHTGDETERGERSSQPPLVTYRYVPAVGAPGMADAEYPVLVPPPVSRPVVSRVTHIDRASVEFNPLCWSELPTLHHVVSGLADIPVLKVLEAKIVEGSGVSDVSNASRLE